MNPPGESDRAAVSPSPVEKKPAMNHLTRQFFLRATGILLLVGGVAMVACYRRLEWGWGAVPLHAWAMLWALVMGWIGFRSAQRTFLVPPPQMVTVVLAGVIARVFVLGASQLAVYVAIDAVWGARALMSTTVFYLVVLGVEVFTLAQAMNRGVFERSKPRTEVES